MLGPIAAGAEDPKRIFALVFETPAAFRSAGSALVISVCGGIKKTPTRTLIGVMSVPLLEANMETSVAPVGNTRVVASAVAAVAARSLGSPRPRVQVKNCFARRGRKFERGVSNYGVLGDAVLGDALRGGEGTGHGKVSGGRVVDARADYVRIGQLGIGV